MDELRIVVCLKQVPDPEAPVSAYRIDSAAKRVTPIGVPPVLSPFDENALELALRLRERHGGKVTAVSVGSNLSKAVLRKALSAGADELILVEDPAFSPDFLDGYGTVLVLAQTINKLGAPHIILTGRQAADTNAGVVGLFLAEALGIVAVTLARGATIEDGNIRVERVLPDGLEVVIATMPALLTVTQEAGELRNISIKNMRDAKNKPLKHWKAADLGMHVIPDRRLMLEELAAPARERKCLIIEGGSPDEVGKKLALRLRNDNVL
ncbi:MAG: electron transfer flavoprotein beta subunit/FixA family protein [Candidatus Abyssobacteria bacterium SURF_17]|uniref:Electron transfer flavoprotein beta subunit/FixA family protein n=1 Tax=Candidatus Abyssobacteria bacterium SURF_17 TaxID=2093361 RepID=A0A419EYX9_9BACT|nr:MAG: electron transfer flavoprotein beta subunit/FixA family protein [Candidatus Abyssubacteria bacterium SURF_17]